MAVLYIFTKKSLQNTQQNKNLNATRPKKHLSFCGRNIYYKIGGQKRVLGWHGVKADTWIHGKEVNFFLHQKKSSYCHRLLTKFHLDSKIYHSRPILDQNECYTKSLVSKIFVLSQNIVLRPLTGGSTASRKIMATT